MDLNTLLTRRVSWRWTVVAAAAAWLILRSLPYGVEVCTVGREGQGRDCDTYQVLAGALLRLLQFTDAHQGFFLVLFTAFFFAATVVLAVIAHRQHRTTSDQVASSKRIERAYVFLSTTPTRNENAKLELVRASPRPLLFVNLGKTPARVETVIASCRHWPNGAVERLTEQPAGQKVETFAVWLAGNGEPLGVKYVQCTATPEQIERAARGDGIIALVGHITYRDIFDDCHDFGFAFEMPGNPPVMVEIPNPDLNYSR